MCPEESDELLQVAYRQSYNEHKTRAFLYRRSEKLDEIQALECESMRSFLGPFSNGAEGERIIDEIQELITNALLKPSQDYEETVFTILNDKFERENDHISKISCFPSIFDFLLMATTTYNETISQNHSKEVIENILIAQISKYKADRQVDNAYNKYFNKSLKDIEQDGTVYLLPKGDHKWKYNANWLLGHLNKLNEFIIYSDITDNAKYDRRGEFGSGFFREISICYATGYRCEKIAHNQIILKLPESSELQIKLQKLTLQDILQKTNDELSLRSIEHFYDMAVSHYKILKFILNPSAQPFIPQLNL